MPRKTSKTQNEENRRSTLQVSRSDAEARINAQIEKGRQLLEVQITNENDLAAARLDRKKWAEFNKELLKRMVDTDELLNDHLRNGSRPLVLGGYYEPEPLEARVDDFRDGLNMAISSLESIVSRLELIPEAPTVVNSAQEIPIRSVGGGNRVFVVHGHDEEAKQSAARCIEKLGLQAIILHEQPNQGRTIIEKFEAYCDVGFAVVLLTPDDLGKQKNDLGDHKPRARQNVVLELGFFLGKLGRDRVCALHKGDVEIPSDFSGVLWVPMDTNGAWRFELGKEMKAAELDVDLNKLV
ncbi:MAG: nucleotide-binding protein [Chloroflexota bacterium]